MSDTIEAPVGYTDEVAEYLATLRESGVTNMFGAGPYLENYFGCSKRVAREWLSYWMKTFKG